MTVIRSKDVVTINDLSEEKRSSDGPSVLEAIEGYQGNAERTLIDKKVSLAIGTMWRKRSMCLRELVRR